MAQKVDNIDTEEKFCAYNEYVSSMLKEEFAMGVRSTLGNPDRHAGNLFIQIDEKTKKVIGAQAIDNDTCGGSKIDAHTEMSGVSFSKLRVIPQSMADAVLNTKPEMFAVLMQGYDLSDNEITAQTATFFPSLQRETILLIKMKP